MWVWRETKEWLLLCGVVLSLALIAIVNYRLPLPHCFEGTWAAPLLRSDATASVTSDLLVGFVSAYFFYLIIELIPQRRKEEQTLRPLNMLVASVIDAYERMRVFGHETPITSIDLGVLDVAKLKAHKADIVTRPNFLRLKFAMETGHSRYQDVQHSLTLAAAVSPEHALDWLVLTDKLRLLAAEYATYPVNPFSKNDLGQPTEEQKQDVVAMAEYTDYQDEMKGFEGTLQLRVLEVFEAAIFWMERQAS